MREYYVLTGGPCAGKTTTILELEKRGCTVIQEPARMLIDEGLAQGKTLDEIRVESFFHEVIHRARKLYEEAPKSGRCFFDRGVPDSLAYYKAFGKEADGVLREALRGVSYKKIFLLDLVDFEKDEARTETPEQAMLIHGLIREAYLDQGFPVVEVPVMPVAERADFILSRL